MCQRTITTPLIAPKQLDICISMMERRWHREASNHGIEERFSERLSQQIKLKVTNWAVWYLKARRNAPEQVRTENNCLSITVSLRQARTLIECRGSAGQMTCLSWTGSLETRWPLRACLTATTSESGQSGQLETPTSSAGTFSHLRLHNSYLLPLLFCSWNTLPGLVGQILASASSYWTFEYCIAHYWDHNNTRHATLVSTNQVLPHSKISSYGPHHDDSRIVQFHSLLLFTHALCPRTSPWGLAFIYSHASRNRRDQVSHEIKIPSL